MTCKLVHEDGFNAFRCNNIGEREMSYKEITGKERLEPYFEDECEHRERFEIQGILKCQQCGMIYDENTLGWRNDEN